MPDFWLNDVASNLELVEGLPDRRQESREFFRELGVLLSRICERRQFFAEEIIERAFRPKAPFDASGGLALSRPRVLATLAAKYFDPSQALRPEAFTKFESLLSEAATLQHDLRCYDDALTYVAEVRDRERRAQRIADAFPLGVRDSAFRTLVKGELYEYQRVRAVCRSCGPLSHGSTGSDVRPGCHRITFSNS